MRRVKLGRVIIAAIMIAIFILPSIPFITAYAQPGQPVETIVFKTVTDVTAGIVEVGSGRADIFLWSQPLKNYLDVPSDILENIDLIPSSSTYTALAINLASNIYDSTKDGEIVVDVAGPGEYTTIQGAQIPGLVYLNAQEAFGSNWVDINEVDVNDRNIVFNPFGVKKIRQALQLIVDRSFLVNGIYQGSANPMLTAIRSSHAAYEWVADIPEELGVTSVADVATGQQLMEEAVNELNAIYSEYGYQLVFKDDPLAPGGKWLYFVYPDGTEVQVEVNFLIRVEDERLDSGRQIANWIESYLWIKVNRIERTRTIVTPLVYGINPIQTSDTIGGRIWHLYTEGWVSVTDSPIYWARYNVSFFYAPLRGYGPNHRVTDWWFWFNKDMYELGYQLWFGNYTPDQVDQLREDIRELTRMGLEEVPRVFLTENLEFFAVNKNKVTGLVFGTTTGLWSMWGVRTARTTDGTLTILEYSAAGALFLSPWNPVLGFTDIYSEVIRYQVADFGMYAHPVTGLPVPIRETWDVEVNPEAIDVPDSAIVYDPVDNMWITVGEAKAQGKDYIPGVKYVVADGAKASAKVTFNFVLGKWHDGTDMTLADILGVLAFYYEWAFDDSQVTGEADPFYDSEIDSAVTGTLDLILGIEVVDEDTIVVYTSYQDVDPALIASSIDMWVWTPIHMLVALEKAVVEDPGGTNYGWTDREATGEIAVDLLKHPDLIAQMATELVGSEAAFKYVAGLNEAAGMEIITAAEMDARLQAYADFINEKGHAVVFNGPYVVESYDPNANVMELSFFEDYPLGKGFVPPELIEITKNNVYGTVETTPVETTPTETETTPTETTPEETTPTETETTPMETEVQTVVITQTVKETETVERTVTETVTETEVETDTVTVTVSEGISTTVLAVIVILIILAAAAYFYMRRQG
ncbi:MAG: peptide transporter [Aeropyrum sp.]|nr:peptide transporter [Aeropyrum sp.]